MIWRRLVNSKASKNMVSDLVLCLSLVKVCPLIATIKQATFVKTRTPAGSESSRYRQRQPFFFARKFHDRFCITKPLQNMVIDH